MLQVEVETRKAETGAIGVKLKWNTEDGRSETCGRQDN